MAAAPEPPWFVIANNCWAGLLYKKLGYAYNVPLVNCFLRADDFVVFCRHVDALLAATLVFKADKPYPYPFPVGTLSATLPDGSFVETHIIFVHYKTNEECAEHWERRAKRIRKHLPLDKRRVLLKMDDRDGCTPDSLRNFHELNAFPHKLSFGATATPFCHANHIRIALNRSPKYVDDGGRLFRSTALVLDLAALVSGEQTKIVWRCPRTPRELLEHCRFERSPYKPICGAEAKLLATFYAALKARCGFDAIEYLNTGADD